MEELLNNSVFTGVKEELAVEIVATKLQLMRFWLLAIPKLDPSQLFVSV